MKTDIMLAILLPQLLLCGFFAFIPVVRGRYAFFGLPVSGELYNGKGRQLLRRYRQMLVIGLLCLCLLEFVLSARGAPNEAIIPLGIFGLTALCLSIYANGFRAVRHLSPPAPAQRIASSMRARAFSDYTVIPVEIAIVLLTLLPPVVLSLFYSRLPARIPIHWNVFAEPDRWSAKSFSSVFLLPLIVIYLQSWLFFLKHDSLTLKLTLPPERSEEYLSYKERSLRLGMFLMDWIRCLVGIVFAVLMLLPVLNVFKADQFRVVAIVLLWSSSALMIGGAVFLIFRWVKLNNDLARRFGFSAVQRRGEIDHWLGGIIYFNRQDSALFVEKLDGMGYTINCGHPRALLHLAALIGLPLLAGWAVWQL